MTTISVSVVSGKTRKGHLSDRNLLIHIGMEFTTLSNQRHLGIDETPRCYWYFVLESVFYRILLSVYDLSIVAHSQLRLSDSDDPW